MDTVTNKAVVIGVAIFITIAITSGIIYTIGLIRDIYKEVYETDTSISNRFSEFDAFDDSTKKGIEVINAINKYKTDNKVTVYISGYSTHNATTEEIDQSQWRVNYSGGGYHIIYLYKDYTSELKLNSDGTVKITFGG